MTFQSVSTLTLVLLSVLYFFRSSLKSAVGGGCASGCDSCQSGGCPVNKLQTLQKNLESKSN